MLRGAPGKGVVHSSLPSLLPWSCHGRTGEDAMNYRQSWEQKRMYTERVEAFEPLSLRCEVLPVLLRQEAEARSWLRKVSPFQSYKYDNTQHRCH